MKYLAIVLALLAATPAYASRIITAGATDQSVELLIIDDTSGQPETGVVYNTSGIDLWYRRPGAAKVSITEATLASLTTAHTDGGFLAISNGVYRLDLPDAAVASGVDHVVIGGTVTGMIVKEVVVQLTAFDLQTATAAVNVTQFGGTNGTFAGGIPSVNPRSAPNIWYVDDGGNDSNDGLTAATAKATWSAVNTASSKGDTIRILEGSYSSFNSCKDGVTVEGWGSPNAIIMTPSFGFVPGQRATIRGIRIDSANDTDSAIVSGGADHVTVENCIINGKADALLNSGGHFWVVRGCYLKGTWDSCNFGDSYGCLFDRCLLVTDCTNNSLVTDFRGLIIGDQNATTVANSKLFNVVQNCRIEVIKSDNASTAKVIGIAAGGRLKVINTDIVARSTHASYNQDVIGICDVNTEIVDTEAAVIMTGGSIQTSKAHASANDKCVSFNYSASTAEFAEVVHEAAKIAQPLQVVYNSSTAAAQATLALKPTVSGRTLSVESDGDLTKVNTIDTGGIAATSFASGAIDATAIAADAIGSSEIATGAIDTNALAASSITASSIATDAITAAKIAADAITSSELADNSIDAGAIAADSIGASEVATGAIDTTALASGAIPSTAFAAGAIDATAIAADAIGASELAASAIGSSELAADAITNAKIATGAFTLDRFSGVFPTNFPSTLINASGHITRVTTTDTATAATSVTNGVTVTTNNDKTGYGLSSGERTTLSAAVNSAVEGGQVGANASDAASFAEAAAGDANTAATNTTGLGAAIDAIPTAAENAAQLIATTATGAAGTVGKLLQDTAGTVATNLDAKVSEVEASVDLQPVLDAVAEVANDVLQGTAAETFFGNQPPVEAEVDANEIADAVVEQLPDLQSTTPRLNSKPDPAFAIQVSRGSGGTYKCTRPIRLMPGPLTNQFVFIDMSPLFGPDNYVKTVGTPTISGGSITTPTENNGPRDTYAVVELDGTATAGESQTVTLNVTMETGAVRTVVFDVKVFTP